MRRAIPSLAAAAALVASGCTSRDCFAPLLNVYWDTFTDSTGRSFNCSDAGSGVAGIQVFVDNQAQFATPVKCIPFPVESPGVEGVGLADFLPGTYQVEVQGLDVNGLVTYVAQTTAAVPSNTCNVQVRVDTNPVAVTGTLDVAYSTSAACRTPTRGSPFNTTFIWYQLFDQNGQLASAADSTVNAQAIPCASTNQAFTIPSLPFGNYTLRGLQEVEILADGTFIVYRFNCVQVGPFSHLADGDLVTVPTLVDQATGGTTTCF